MEGKEFSKIAVFIISLQRHMEMDFGYKGRDFHIDFTSDETDAMEIAETTENDEKDTFYAEYESVEDLFENCFIDGASFEEILYHLDYIRG